MTIIHGRILQVFDRTLGASLVTAPGAGASTLYLDDTSDLTPEGGQVVIIDEVNGNETVTYTAVDFDADTITVSPVTTLAHSVDDEVRVEPYTFERLAVVQLDDPDLAPVTAVVPFSLQALLEPGLRSDVAGDDELTFSTEEEVVLELRGSTWTIADVLRASALVSSDNIDTDAIAEIVGSSAWYSGATAPDNAWYNDGDHYLNTTNGDVYEKVAGAWSLITNISGPGGDPGTDGATWYDGSGAPAGGLGVDGDHYFDNSNGDVYLKAGGVWSVVGNLTGPQGDPGTPGTDGSDGATWYSGAGAPSGALGVDGDHYLNTTTDDVYLKSGGSWSVIGNFAGTNGTNGTDGATWYSGSGAPGAGLGVDGDHYLDTDTGDVYLKSGGSWALEANIQAPPSDGSVPSASPSTLSAITGLKVIHLRWSSVTNNDAVTYEVYMKPEGGAYALLAKTGATAMTVKTDTNGDPIIAGTTPATVYYFKVLATDADGPAGGVGTETYSPEASGYADLVGLGDIVAGTITAEMLNSELVLSSHIYTAEPPGSRVEISTINGIEVIDGNNKPIVQLPTSGTPFFSGDIVASGLTVENNSTFRNTGTFDKGSTFLLASTQADPSTAPSVTQGYASATWTGMPDNEGYDSAGAWYDNGFVYYFALRPSVPGQYFVKVNAATGALVTSTAIYPTGESYSTGRWTSLVKLGSYWYGLWLKTSPLPFKSYWVRFNDSTGYPGTEVGSATLWAEAEAVPNATVTTDGTSLWVASAHATLPKWRFHKYADPTGAVPSSPTLYTSSPTYIEGSFAPRSSFYVGNGDLGAARIIIRNESYSNYYYAFDTTGTWQANSEFDSAGGVGLYYDSVAGKFKELKRVADGTTWQVYTFENFLAGSVSRTATTPYQWAYTWWDSDGTTHESGLSPRRQVDAVKRKLFSVGWATIPDLGGADDPNAVKVYALQSGSDPGSAHASYYQQGIETGTGQTYTSYSTSTVGSAGTAFPGGGPASLETQSAGMKLKGDGTFVMPVFASSSRPTSPEQGRMYFDSTVGAFYVYNGSAWMPFGGFLGAQAIKGANQAITTGINGYTVVSLSSSSYDTGATNGAGTNTPFFDDANDKFTVPTGAGGMYEIVAVGQWATPGTTCDTRITIHKNATITAGAADGASAIADQFARSTSAGRELAIVVPMTVQLAAGDTLHMCASHNQGSNLNLQGNATTRNTYFQVTYLGPKHA